MFGIGTAIKAVKLARTVSKLPAQLKATATDGRELKDAIDEAIERTAIVIRDGQYTDSEIDSVGRAWINVAKEGNDLLPLIRRAWRLIS